MEETENKRAVEIDVADALLDTGLLVKVPAPRPLRMLGIKVFPMRFRRPVYAQLLRISRMYVWPGSYAAFAAVVRGSYK